MQKKTAAAIMLIVTIIFLIGTLFILTRLWTNQDQHEENEQVPGYDETEEYQDEEDTIDLQKTISSVCGLIFIITLTLTVFLFVKANRELNENKDPQMQQMPAQGPAAPAGNMCPACGTAGQFSQEQNDHYCWQCKSYFNALR